MRRRSKKIINNLEDRFKTSEKLYKESSELLDETLKSGLKLCADYDNVKNLYRFERHGSSQVSLNIDSEIHPVKVIKNKSGTTEPKVVVNNSNNETILTFGTVKAFNLWLEEEEII